MTIDGLYFPDKIQNLTKASSFDELKVSTGVPRYFVDEEGFWGFHLGNCGLTQEDWRNMVVSNNSHREKLRILHLGNSPSGKNPNVIDDVYVIGYYALTFIDVSHNSQLKELNVSGGRLEKIIASDCPKLAKFVCQGGERNLVQIEIARCSLKRGNLNGELSSLKFLELSDNQLEYLRIPASCQKLEYLFVRNNQLESLDFEGDIPPLEIIDLQNNPFEDDALRGLANQNEEDGKTAAIVAYFERQKQGKTREIKRVKLIFLGNTGVGKTTLSDILTNNTKATPKHKDEDVSTHGINLFKYFPKDTDIKVQGFDFGGQDYFHNTHFAFFEQNALYILLWGNGQEDKLDYSHKEERRFPLNYWLGSVRYFLKTNNKKAELNNTLHLLQNIASKERQILELDNRSLKAAYPFVRELRHFNLLAASDKSSVREWLDTKINEFCKPISINVIDDEVATFIRNHKNVILPLAMLCGANSILKDYDDEQLRYLALALHGTLACFYQPPLTKAGEATRLSNEQSKALEENLVANLEKFTGWIYTILAPEIKGNGYFTQKQAENRLEGEAKSQIDFILGFMLQHKIIFRAGESIKESEQRFVSPHYLSDKQSLTEQLFLSSFEEPLVKYHFREFFHTNLITEVMLEYYHQLLRDGKWQYVMWKNKVILYEENDKKKLLLIDFEEEKDEKTNEKIASIRLHRFIKNAVSDDFVKKVMAFIEGKIENYQHEKLIVTPFGDYMPADCLEQQNVNGEGKDEGLVYHHNKIYRKADFKLFLKNPDAYPKKRLFISYSSQNSEFFKRFLVHLAPLQRMGIVDYWHDRMITNGTLWDEKIQKELESSDIVVFLLSPDFLNVPYVLDVEIPKAKEFKKHPFFIQLMDCGWQRFDMLNQYQNASDQKQTNKNFINLKGNPNDSATWEKIIDDLKSTIENLTPKKNAPTNGPTS